MSHSMHPWRLEPARDWGRLFARVLCLVFGVLGALPLGAGFLIRSDWAQVWAARETARVFRESVGVDASYDVRLSLVPFELSLQNVAIAANDGGTPAFVADRISVAPRLFALLGGRLDVGEVEIYRPRVRLVIVEGELQNVSVSIDRDSDSIAPQSDALPFRVLSVTDGIVDLSWDETRVSSSSLDIDLFAQPEGAVEVALRIGETAIAIPSLTEHGAEEGPPVAWDADVLCQVDARLRLSQDRVLVRRFSALGELDVDPTPGRGPACVVSDKTPEGRVALKTERLVLSRTEDARPFAIDGSIMVRVPLQIFNRLSPAGIPWRGWLGLTGTLNWRAGNHMPDLSGKLKTGPLWYGPHRLVDLLDGPVEIVGDRVFSPELASGYAGGKVRITDFQLEPLEPGVPLHAGRVEIDDVWFPKLMRDTYVSSNAIVDFTINDTIVDNFHGTVLPLVLDGELRAFADGFKIYDRSYRDAAAERVFGINSRASVVGMFGVRDTGLQFDKETIRFGTSRVDASVRVGFANWIELDQPKGEIELADVSPIASLPLSGVASLQTTMGGPRNDPVLRGTIGVTDLVVGGFAIGELRPTAVRFQPLKVDLSDVQIDKGGSAFKLPDVQFDFEAGPTLVLDAAIATESADIRDFLAMWNLDADPRWSDLSGRVGLQGQLRYLIGGVEDICKSGRLRVSGGVHLARFGVFGETFDSGDAEVAFDWFDIPASHRGMSLSVPALHAHKGGGSVLGSVDIRKGGKLHANVLGSGIPLARIDALGDLATLASGTASFGALYGGTLDAMEASLSAQVGSVIMGRSRAGGSRLDAVLVPKPRPADPAAEKTTCGEPVALPFDPVEFAADSPTGEYRVTGELFAGAVRIDGLRVANARSKTIQGVVEVNDLDLAPVLQLHPAVALASAIPTGEVSGRMTLRSWPLDDWSAADATWDIAALKVAWNGFGAELLGKPRIDLARRELSTAGLAIQVRSPDGYTTVFDLSGRMGDVGATRNLNARFSLRPVELARFEALFDSGSRLGGTLVGALNVTGPIDHVTQEGGFTIRGGELGPRDGGLSLTEADIDIALDGGALTITRAKATLGGGTVSATGSAPLRGLALGTLRGEIRVEGANVPISPGVAVVVDADLEGQWTPLLDDTRVLPSVKGRVDLRNFEYTRPITMNADISALTGKAKSTKFEHYDPSLDLVNFDVLVNASQPLRINNNLLEARLSIDRPGLRLKGTNQRYGVRGRVQVEPGGRIHFRRNEFEVLNGEVRFDDPTDISPRVDLRAVTEYRRFSSTTATGSAATASQTASGASTVGSAAGQWRIAMHAHGDTDELKLDLSSQPELSQDDIFLLLTLGLTRAELDQANLQGSVALEALGSLTGADTAVKEAIPVIDEFRFGSSYSARTGRSEPTVTVGKRLTERIRAYVTSGLTESREVRSNLEWRLNPRTSVEGSYDNINDISSSNVGNIGADVRWRIEF